MPRAWLAERIAQQLTLKPPNKEWRATAEHQHHSSSETAASGWLGLKYDANLKCLTEHCYDSVCQMDLNAQHAQQICPRWAQNKKCCNVRHLPPWESEEQEQHVHGLTLPVEIHCGRKSRNQVMGNQNQRGKIMWKKICASGSPWKTQSEQFTKTQLHFVQHYGHEYFTCSVGETCWIVVCIGQNYNESLLFAFPSKT